MYEPRRSLKPFRRHNGVKYHAPLMKVPFIRVQQGVLTGSWRIKDGGREGGDGVSPSVLLRRTSKRKMQSWRFRSNRGHCRACSFSFRLLLGYYTLSIQYYGVFFTRLSLHSGTPFFALWLSTVHLSPCFWQISFVKFHFSKQVESCCRGMRLDPGISLTLVALNLWSLKEECGLYTCRAFL